MRIGYFIESVIPSKRANTVHVMRMCQAFTKLGYEVTLYCDEDDKKVELEEIWDQYGINEKFKIERVYLSDLVRKHGHRFAAMISAKKKSKSIENIDFAYGRSPYCMNFIKDKIPYIFEAHSEPDRFNIRLERNILKHHNCRGLVVISEALKKRYLEIFPFLKEEQVTVLHDCADIPENINVSSAQLKEIEELNPVKIGYLGHLYPGKCMEVLIPVAEACPEFSFHIVGGTEEWITYWKKIIMSKNIKNIVFYGFVNNSEVGKYYRAFDICILPFSKEVYVAKNKFLNIGKWISPLKLFEAMAYKKAILVSKLPTIEEVLTDYQNCIFVEPDDIMKWREKIIELSDNPQLRERLGMEARKELEKNYTWEKRARSISKIMRG